MLTEKSRILVVDDFEMVRVMLKRCLNTLGYADVHEAVDGKQALQMITKADQAGTPFGLVFADWNMPHMSGLDLLQACRADGRLKQLPFVMVTAESERQFVVQALNAGATDYIIKPFSEETLQKKIEKIGARLKRAAA
jgi:two-component system, chemotaxis family, chemotaxis protein CheY